MIWEIVISDEGWTTDCIASQMQFAVSTSGIWRMRAACVDSIFTMQAGRGNFLVRLVATGATTRARRAGCVVGRCRQRKETLGGLFRLIAPNYRPRAPTAFVREGPRDSGPEQSPKVPSYRLSPR